MQNYHAIFKTLAISVSLLATSQALAETTPQSVTMPIDFYHKDWQLVCDNTRTCRAVGYQPSDVLKPIALQLIRQAGANQPILALIFVTLDSLSNEESSPELDYVTMHIDNKNMGKITLDKIQAGKLTQPQTKALLAAVTGTHNITFTNTRLKKPITWQLSNAGANAVLLKMDEVQGRIGTGGAIINRGTQSESAVLPTIAKPVIFAQRINDKALERATDKPLFATLANTITQIVLPTLDTKDDKDNSCDFLTDKSHVNDSIEKWGFYRLNAHKILATHECWRGAYNQGFGMWVINDKPPYQPQWITSSASGYSDGEISAAQKGRGIGDCWWLASWVWNGTTFVKSEDLSTGLCRGFTGGAVELPSLVTTVIFQ